MGPAEIEATALLGPLPKKELGHQLELVISDWFSKLVWSLLLQTTTTIGSASAFMIHTVYAYGALLYVLTDIVRRSVAELLEIICAMLGATHYRTTADLPQTRGQTEQAYRSILHHLPHQAEEHQKDPDIYLQPLTYACNLERTVHRK